MASRAKNGDGSELRYGFAIDGSCRVGDDGPRREFPGKDDGVTYTVSAGNGNLAGRAIDACTVSPARVANAITVACGFTPGALACPCAAHVQHHITDRPPSTVQDE